MARQKADTQQVSEQKPDLVRMVRDPEEGGPCEADVHPEEVRNYMRNGWYLPEQQTWR